MAYELFSPRSHLYFAREGAGSSATVKPAGGDAAWIEVGIVDELNVEPNIEEREIWAPMPGRLVRKDVIEVRRSLNFSAKVTGACTALWELLFSSAKLNPGGSVAYVPGAAATIKGWIKVVSYDEKDGLRNTVEVWCRAKVTARLSKEEVVGFDFTAMELYSTLNAGTLTNVG